MRHGFVVMPERVHLLVSEPVRGSLANAMHFLELAFAKRQKSMPEVRDTVPQVRGRFSAPANLGSPGNRPTTNSPPFWPPRYYNRNVRDAYEFMVKLRDLHRNPARRGLLKEALDWKWSSFRHYALREIGVVEI